MLSPKSYMSKPAKKAHSREIREQMLIQHRQELAEGYTQESISRSLGCTRRTVVEAIKRLGIERERGHRGYWKPFDEATASRIIRHIRERQGARLLATKRVVRRKAPGSNDPPTT